MSSICMSSVFYGITQTPRHSVCVLSAEKLNYHTFYTCVRKQSACLLFVCLIADVFVWKYVYVSVCLIVSVLSSASVCVFDCSCVLYMCLCKCWCVLLCVCLLVHVFVCVI